MKKFLIALLILILIPVILALLFILTFDLNTYRPYLETKLSNSLKMPVKIGRLYTKLKLVPTIQISDIVISNNENKPILVVPGMEATLELIPLIQKQVRIPKIVVPVLNLNLQNSKTETLSNTEAKENKVSHPKEDLTKIVWIEEIQIKKANIFFPLKEKVQNLTLENLAIKKMSKFSLAANYLNQDYTIEGNFGSFLLLLNGTNNLPIDLVINSQKNFVSLKGQIGDFKKMDNIRLDINTNIQNLSDFIPNLTKESKSKIDLFDTFVNISLDGNIEKLNLKKIEMNLGRNSLQTTGKGTLKNVLTDPVLDLNLTTSLKEDFLKEKLNLNYFDLKTQLKFQKGVLELNNLKYTANKSDFSGKIKLDFKSKPINIQGNLESYYLSLNDVFFKSEQKKIQDIKKASQENSTIPNTVLPWKILSDFNLDGKIQIQNAVLTSKISDYASLSMTPTLKDGIFKTPIQMRFLSGSINSIFLFNQKNKEIQMKAKIENLNLDKASMIQGELKNAVLFADLTFQSKGNTVKELLANSDGKITMEVMNGKITNKWINTLSESFSQNKNKSAFSTTEKQTNLLCWVINFPLKKGVLTSNETAVIQTDVLDIISSGELDLNKETINISMVPSLPATIGNTSKITDMVNVVHIKGPWKDPEITIDTQKVVSGLINFVLNGKKQNIQGQTANLSKTTLCEKALGRSLPTIKKQTKANKPTHQLEEKGESKKDIKQQLINSLTQVLKKQGQ